MSGTLKVGGKTLATHDTNTNVAKIQLGSTSDVVLTDSAGNNVLSESGGVVTLTADEANVGSNALVVDSSGRVGIGTSSPSSFYSTANNLVVSSSSSTTGITIHSTGDSSIYFADGTSGSEPYRGILQYSHASDALRFYTAAAEKMSIDSSGNVKINNLSSSSDVQTDASKNLITTSDARLKNEIGLIDESGIEVIKQIIPKYFSWKNDENNNQQLGFFAQDIYPVLPEAAPRVLKYTEVGRDENDEPILEQVFDENGNPDYEWGFTDRPIIAMCVKAIQEQQAIIKFQQSQIDALTARIEALEATP
jgi:hypothetical protein